MEALLSAASPHNAGPHAVMRAESLTTMGRTFLPFALLLDMHVFLSQRDILSATELTGSPQGRETSADSMTGVVMGFWPYLVMRTLLRRAIHPHLLLGRKRMEV
ncbi:hypothetical protein NQZ68_039147 [Dissostichus eleginoides]|nr:hypothetical protein NQZ68_041572 [Dissostichus eleginoides]KAI9545151.1 hypothetical protein NQZ68_039147 [Dissostichus eleginoides]